VGVHLIGKSNRSLVDIADPPTFHNILRVRGAASPEGTLASARVSCPRYGSIDGSECVDCVHLHAWRATPEVRLYCSVDSSDPVARWMRTKPPATTVDTRCHAADEFAVARGVHHLLVFDRQLALVGVACRCDLARGDGRAVSDVMSNEVFAVEPATTIGVASAALKQLRIGCLPVVSGPLVLGILTRSDLDRAGAPA
jgi:CBS-domain-containing membrane protein